MTQPVTIPDVLASRAQSPRGVAFLDADGEHTRWTFGELGQRAKVAAGALHQRGVREGDRVGLLGSTSPELVAAVFGCWTMGAIAVPLAVPLRITSIEALTEEVRSRAERASISVLAVDASVDGLIDLDGIAAQTCTLDQLVGPPIDFAEPDPDAPALIQFTSGSTAQPKGVALSHRTLITNGHAAGHHTAMTPEDVVVSWLPLYHDFGLIGFTLWPVVLDMATYLIPPETFIGKPGLWMRAISDHGATITAAPNFAFGLAARALARMEDRLDLSTMRLAANGAEPVDADTMATFVEAAEPHGFRTGSLIGVYGLAEATLGVAAPAVGRPPPPWWVEATSLPDHGPVTEVEEGHPDGRPLVSVGQPIPGVEIEIRDPHLVPCADGVVGEIWLRTEHAMLGYWDDDEATAEALVDGWVRTGDIGVMGPDGLYITGRVKDMIIVGGRNIYPEDAERVAARIPGVRKGNAVAFAARAKERLVVLAETRLSGEEATQLARQVATEVTKALRVAADQVVLLLPGSLPKTPSGKLQRRLTKTLFEAESFVHQMVAAAGRGTPATS